MERHRQAIFAFLACSLVTLTVRFAVDMAKEVYRNATMQAISILRVVNNTGNRQDSFYEGIDAIREHLRHLVHEHSMVNDSMGKFNLDVRRGIQHANEQIKAVTVVKNALSSVFAHHSEAYGLLLNEVSREVRSVVGDVRIQLPAILCSARTLTKRARKHTITLELLVPSLQAALEAQVSTTFAQVRTQYQDLNDITLTAQVNWRAAGHEVGLMKETVSALVHTISESVVVLDSHVDQAVLANRMQVETTEAVSRLGTVLTGLVLSTRTEMEKINNTAVAVRDQWLAASSMQVPFFDWQRWSNWSQCRPPSTTTATCMRI
ncbi:hypothetical protein BC835DRAFT_1310688 [Cytidiella melzeri]|nr:hypothetical protein BC835DRAFT_1310688 [Cytidiella melzeri]